MNEIKRRFFVLDFICETCNKSHRLFDLEEDFVGKLRCTHCGYRSFQIKKQLVTEQHFRNLRGKDKIIETKLNQILDNSVFKGKTIVKHQKEPLGNKYFY